jgi:Mor family transcriptional regulator
MNEEEQKAHDAAVAAAREANSVMNTDRLKKIEAIADTADHQDEDEAKEAEAARADAAAAELMAKGLQEEGAQPETEKLADTEVTTDTKVVNGETYYLQVVNGKEKWQTLADIRRTASKVDGADEYLQQASEAVKNASRLALSQQDVQSNVEKVDVRAILRAAVLGDEEAIEKLASVLETRPSEVTPDVVRQIDQRLSFRTELASLEDKSKDLLENQYTKRLFRDRLNEMKAENPTMGLTEAYTSIDKELRTAFPNVAKTKTSDKLERKRTLVNVPTAASRQVEEAEPEGEEDVGDVIAKIAKARHVDPIIHGPRRQ